MKIITKHPIAYESPDHIFPNGTKYDNTTNPNFIVEVEKYIGIKPIKFLDIGCAGGQLVVDFHNKGHISVGIEGSDYSVTHYRANWPQYYNNILFTCDATKPYTIIDDNNVPILFDIITAWEVIEHIHPNELDQFFLNILNHMSSTSFFVGSISTMKDAHPTIKWHQSIFPKEIWANEILPKYFIVEEYPFVQKVRYEETSFWVKLTPK